MSRRRLQEIAFMLPVFGLFLLLPPVVTIWQALSRATGFPLFLGYIFVCWFALIALAFALSRRLRLIEEPRPVVDGTGMGTGEGTAAGERRSGR
jgi:hypothetical protein